MNSSMTSAQYPFEPVSFTPIAYIQSPFKQRYGVPRQPGLAKNAVGLIQFKKDPDLISALKTIEQFSHLWIIFIFHQHGGKKWKPSIRPPRLGGRTKVGVLASRSPHRPNPIGISVVKINKVYLNNPQGPSMEVQGLDLLDGTPILDVKPYIPYADAIPEAVAGWATPPIERLAVTYSQKAQRFLQTHLQSNSPSQEKSSSFTQGLQAHVFHAQGLQDLITEVLELDPRPAYLQREEPASAPQFWGKIYGIEISGFEVKYTFNADGILVLSIL